jgi:hypothetical protein
MGRFKLPRKAGGFRGPLPEPFERCELVIEKRPTDEWMELHGAELERGEIEPDDEDMYVGLNIYGFHVIPKANTPPSQWPQGRTLMLTLTEVPYVEFRAECLRDLDRRNAPAPEPADHRAELLEVADKALEAARAARAANDQAPAKVAPGEFAMTEAQDATDVAAAMPAMPWWRRLWYAAVRRA